MGDIEVVSRFTRFGGSGRIGLLALLCSCAGGTAREIGPGETGPGVTGEGSTAAATTLADGTGSSGQVTGGAASTGGVSTGVVTSGGAPTGTTSVDGTTRSPSMDVNCLLVRIASCPQDRKFLCAT